jgi:hypothetical protein
MQAQIHPFEAQGAVFEMLVQGKYPPLSQQTSADGDRELVARRVRGSDFIKNIDSDAVAAVSKRPLQVMNLERLITDSCPLNRHRGKLNRMRIQELVELHASALNRHNNGHDHQQSQDSFHGLAQRKTGRRGRPVKRL